MNTRRLHENGNIIKQNPSVEIPADLSIRNLNTFMQTYTLYNGKFNKRYSRVKDKLLQIKESFNGMDPVELLYFYYFTEELSFRDISKRLENKNISWGASTLSNLFVNTFSWSPRDNTESTKISTKKNHSNYSKNPIKKLNEGRQKETLEKVRGLIALSPEGTIQINTKEYKELKNKKQKISYILKYLGILTQTNTLSDFLNELQSEGFGGDRQAQILKTLIKNKTGIEFNIDSKEVDTWKKEGG